MGLENYEWQHPMIHAHRFILYRQRDEPIDFIAQRIESLLYRNEQMHPIDMDRINNRINISLNESVVESLLWIIQNPTRYYLNYRAVKLRRASQRDNS